jgi:flagellar hook-associated protein 1 FlgK
MSDLMSLLSMGSAGIAAQNSGIAVATNNVANANTEGYSRQEVTLESVLGPPLAGGVKAGDTARYASELLSQRIRTASGSLAGSTARQSAISDLETSLTSGTTVDTRLANLFSKISQASATPTDSVARDAVVQATRDLVTEINDRAAQITDARQSADARVGDNVPQAAQLAQQLADANKLVGKSNDPAALDKRDQLAKQLADLVGGNAQIGKDGKMRFVLDNGAVLVDGAHAATMTTTTDPTTGYKSVSVVDGAFTRDVTNSLGGKLGADLTFRDTTAKASADALDRLAYDTATAMNGVHAANAALDGTTGHSMFVPPFVVSGAAAALKIDPTLDADSSMLALAGAGTAPGDNTGGKALFALASAKVGGGGTQTLTDAAGSIVANIGLAGAAAKSDVDRDTLVSDNLAGLRDSLSGVDTQEELTNLARFQHASSAMTKFVTTIDDLLTNLIQQL